MLRSYLFHAIACFLSICTLPAQITPNDPVLDFSLPRFGDNGYAQWILRGGKGIYDSDEQVRVEDLSLRVYSGDEDRILEMTIESPKATLLVRENRAVSESPIEITGLNFKVSGVGWTWDGSKKEIEVKADVAVEFSQEITGMLSGKTTSNSADARSTEITSVSLSLKTTAEAYRFQFTDSVSVVSANTELKSELLVAIADIPKGENTEDTDVANLELESIDKIIATERVKITQAGHILEAEEAEFSLREQSAVFKGNPNIKTTGAYLSGDLIRSEEGKLVVEGRDGFGRAQMIVYEAGDLNVSKGVSLDQETLVLADTIKMQELEAENQFSCKGSVEITSGSTLMRTDNLTLYLDPTVGGAADDKEAAKTDEGSGDDFQLGEVVRVIGEGSVYLKQEAQIATCDHAVFYPQKEHALLSGNPKVILEQAVITGDTMDLKPGLAIVNGLNEELAKVVLPKLPDLGADDLELIEGLQLVEPEEAETEDSKIVESETIIRAETLTMTENLDHYLLNLTDSVSIVGTNLKAFCDSMDVIIVESKDESSSRKEKMQVQTVNAYENVLFEQSNRTATADKAMINPIEGEVVLEGNAVLTDVQGRVDGHRIILHKGKGRAIVEGSGKDGSRPRITLPEMDLPELDL